MSTFNKEKEVTTGRRLVKHRERKVNLNCLSTGQKVGLIFCRFLQGNLLPSQWNCVQRCPIWWASLWQVVCSLHMKLRISSHAPSRKHQMVVRFRCVYIQECACILCTSRYWRSFSEIFGTRCHGLVCQMMLMVCAVFPIVVNKL